MQSLFHQSQTSVAGVFTGRGRGCLRPFRGQPAAVNPYQIRRTAARRSLIISNGVGDVAKYLSEAASSIFKTSESNVPWEGSGTPFSGRITHHDEVSRLKKVYELVKDARQQVEGCTNPNAANYNPDATADDGTCTFVVPESDKELSGDLYTYVTSSLSSLWGSNFDKASDKEKRADFSKLGLTGYSGDKVISQRDIQRLLSYEKVVKKALDQAEQDVKST